jgi:NitT/TauT family transport system substrate-binding protein
MDQLKNDEVDAASAMIYNEYGLLLESGYDKSKLGVIDMNDAGVAMLEDCLFVNSKWAAKNGDLLVRFLRASIKGWADAVKDPVAAGTLVFNVDKSVSLAHQTYMAKEVAKLVVPSGFDAAKIGYIDPAAFKQTAGFALKYGLLSKAADLKGSVDDSYWTKATKK